ncbi:MAG TPA: hypothetical protein VGI21_06460 [Streptosporangiaceae bacterium]|jgi:hypothetical protein
MDDVARDPAALDLLQRQRDRLADRMRPPRWFLAGTAIGYALVFAGPFATRYLSQGYYWAIAAATVPVSLLLLWGLDRTTGMKVGPRPLRVLRDGLFYYRPGRSALIAMLVVSLATNLAENSLIRRGQIAAAVTVAVFAVVVEVALVQARLRGIRQALREGGGAA